MPVNRLTGERPALRPKQHYPVCSRRENSIILFALSHKLPINCPPPLHLFGPKLLREERSELGLVTLARAERVQESSRNVCDDTCGGTCTCPINRFDSNRFPCAALSPCRAPVDPYMSSSSTGVLPLLAHAAGRLAGRQQHCCNNARREDRGDHAGLLLRDANVGRQRLASREMRVDKQHRRDRPAPVARATPAAARTARRRISPTACPCGDEGASLGLHLAGAAPRLKHCHR